MTNRDIYSDDKPEHLLYVKCCIVEMVPGMHKPGHLLYVKCCIVEMVPGMTNRDIYCMLSVALSKWFQ